MFRDNDNVWSASSSVNSSGKKDKDDGDYDKSASIAAMPLMLETTSFSSILLKKIYMQSCYNAQTPL